MHIRGVDELTTDNIKEFAALNFSLEHPARVEWIDDTSANIVYSSPEIGLQALAALTHDGHGEIEGTAAETANANANAENSALRLRSAEFCDQEHHRCGREQGQQDAGPEVELTAVHREDSLFQARDYHRTSRLALYRGSENSRLSSLLLTVPLGL